MLTLIVLVAPALVWQYAVSSTVEQWRTTNRYRRQIEQLRKTQTHGTDRYDTPATADNEMILSGELIGVLLPVIETEKLRIEHFSPCITSEADGMRLATGQLSVRGRFVGIVRLLDFLERKLPHCKIISTHYRTNRPRNRNEDRTLSCIIYVQQITTNT